MRKAVGKNGKKKNDDFDEELEEEIDDFGQSSGSHQFSREKDKKVILSNLNPSFLLSLMSLLEESVYQFLASPRFIPSERLLAFCAAAPRSRSLREAILLPSYRFRNILNYFTIYLSSYLIYFLRFLISVEPVLHLERGRVRSKSVAGS